MTPYSPTLAELQHAVQRHLHGAGGDASAWIVPDGFTPDARLAIYRHTATAVLVNAIRLAFPAVQRLVGAACFEGAARRFIDASPPDSAWLDEYGATFPAFLARLPETASIPYLADVANLEWQVNGALHAPDTPALDVARLASIDEEALAALRLCPHPAVRLVRCAFPADAIWRAVLEQDESAMRAVRLGDGPVSLLVQRTAKGIDVVRLGDGEHRVAMALFAGEAIRDALSLAPQTDGYAMLATLLARECFVESAAAPDAGTRSGGSTSCPT
ncbi:putative DNA-binding domain-containing protein (plasmid) [Burkholderia thailandensis]|uniref:HvfC/BufC N-terminal domain-containing protein n=1 Tax=Burkholderia thailandensis TaxID=57975 RepID=UPI00192D58DB|nr:DNA-binding domain-containing protein [Burkholderia thailandensis]MBS2132221.1 putative DNA-binding domain-containing protein [Burkholderia thailandensis]QRA15316.1 putative DNA-binding domain-containing protein [Burkholderia thailandensis]